MVLAALATTILMKITITMIILNTNNNKYWQGLPRTTQFLELVLAALPEWISALQPFPAVTWPAFIGDHCHCHCHYFYHRLCHHTACFYRWPLSLSSLSSSSSLPSLSSLLILTMNCLVTFYRPSSSLLFGQNSKVIRSKTDSIAQIINEIKVC